MRHRLRMIGNESGATMMFVLMAMILVGAITVSAMQVIGSDVGGGIEELQADQVFNIANAGVHYAIGKLQASGSTTYAGETRTITNGSTTLGTATIIVLHVVSQVMGFPTDVAFPLYVGGVPASLYTWPLSPMLIVPLEPMSP